MFKTTLTAVATGVALFAGVIGSANALELTAGNYKIIFDNYDAGTTGYTVPCNTVATCDASATTPAPGNMGTSIDTQGIFSIASINNLATGQDQYIRGQTSTIGGVTFGPFLTGVFTGLTDYNAQFFGPFTQTLSVGGTFAVYSNPNNYNPTLGPTGPGVNLPAGTYPTITGGSLFLSGVFAPGVITGDNTTTYTSFFNSGTFAGNGQGFLDFTGGSAQSFFDTNSLVNGRDAFLTSTFDNVAGVASSLGWTVKSSSQVSGLLLPEPDSLALFAVALLALGATIRRANKKV